MRHFCDWQRFQAKPVIHYGETTTAALSHRVIVLIIDWAEKIAAMTHGQSS
jgi:hypothetical protein